jgi:hypothetical protein
LINHAITCIAWDSLTIIAKSNKAYYNFVSCKPILRKFSRICWKFSSRLMKMAMELLVGKNWLMVISYLELLMFSLILSRKLIKSWPISISIMTALLITMNSYYPLLIRTKFSTKLILKKYSISSILYVYIYYLFIFN